MKDDTNGMQEPQYSTQDVQQLQQQQQYGNMGFYADDREIENARVYYLESDELLNDVWKLLTGRDSLNSPRQEDVALMKDAATKVLLNQIRIPSDKLSRLSTYSEDEIRGIMLHNINTIAGWLMMQGWIKYGISVDNFEIIMNQCEQILLGSYNWAKNSGGRRFMTTTNKSIESQTSMINATAQGKKVLESKDGGMFKKFKPF